MASNFTKPSSIGMLVLSFVVGMIALYWTQCVQQIVSEPYLDEVFHIRQAQAYLQGRWAVWDPKITTPPGLYFVSYCQYWAWQSLGLSDFGTTQGLRSINFVGGLLILLLVRRILNLVTNECEANGGSLKQSQRASNDAFAGQLNHTAVNICLFPPLFFFYGLYYTDILSAFSVLYAYKFHLKDQQNKVIFAGLASLLFRQTNIFWVAVFFGGLQLCRTVPKGRLDVEYPRRPNLFDVISGSWQHACAYDPLLSEASFEDYLKAAISFAIAALRHISALLWSLSSYIFLLCAFAEFVVWNGGVVLGDKENHVASIHLSQMLYIWPYFTFFSFPLLYHYLLNSVVPQESLPAVLRSGSTRHLLPRIAWAVPILATMLAVVYYNTIIHPFTLADNRHYMFYVFRILLRHPIIKYLAVPIYLICAWTCLTALSQDQPTMNTSKGRPSSGNRVSFVLVWLLATSLSLIGAPLVEPRYFIVPWLIWRVHLESPRATSTPSTSSKLEEPKSKDGTMWQSTVKDIVYNRIDHRLWLETIWFLIVNAITGYIFLYWGFEWPQEKGNVQRFMW